MTIKLIVAMLAKPRVYTYVQHINRRYMQVNTVCRIISLTVEIPEIAVKNQYTVVHSSGQPDLVAIPSFEIIPLQCPHTHIIPKDHQPVGVSDDHHAPPLLLC